VFNCAFKVSDLRLQTLQHSIFQSLPKTPHVGVRGFAKSLPPATATLHSRPSSPSSPNIITHSIPSPKGTNAALAHSSLADVVSDDLASPRQGQAVVTGSKSKRRSRKNMQEGHGKNMQEGHHWHGASSHSNESRASSAKPAAVMVSKHAHSILHTCLIRGPASSDCPSPSPFLPDVLVTSTSQTQAEEATSTSQTQAEEARARRPRTPFRGFATPSMSSNEMQVRLKHIFSSFSL
jgi:hypothetical protein